MVITGLTSLREQDGRELTLRLDKAGLRVRAALWMYDPANFSWHLLFGIEEVDELGPRFVYGKIRSAIQRNPTLGSIDLSDVSAESPRNQLFKTLRTALHVGTNLSSVRFSRNTINELYIEDAVIYRV